MNTQTQYEALYKAKGCPSYLVPATREEVKAALAAGDEALNTIPLRKWDIYASSVGWTSKGEDAYISFNQF